MRDAPHSSYPNERKTNMDLRLVLKILRKWSKLIICITLLAAIAAGLLSTFVLKPVYQAKTLMMVTVASEKLEVNRQVIQTEENGVNIKAPMPVLTMNTYLGQLESEELMKRIITRLNLTNQTINSLSAMIDASIVKDSNLIDVKVRHTDPVMARNIANALSEEYLKLMEQFMFSSVVVISPANIPTAPIKPNIMLNIALSFMLGLILSIFLAILLEYLDNTLKTAEDVENALHVPVLGIIPFQSEIGKQHSYGGSL